MAIGIVEGLLLAVVIVLSLWFLYSYYKKPTEGVTSNCTGCNGDVNYMTKWQTTLDTPRPDFVGRQATTSLPATPAPSAPPAETPASKKSAIQEENYEKKIALALNEGFATAESNTSSGLMLDLACASGQADILSGDNFNLQCTKDNAFAKYEYGAPGYSYADFVASQAVDKKAIQNHTEYVRDRQGLGIDNVFLTGRTWSPDSNESYDPIPWTGLQRPAYVQQANPSQVPDIDTSMYKANGKFCLRK